MIENSAGTYDEISGDTLNKGHKFFETIDSLLYFQEIPENESILYNSVHKSVIETNVDNFVPEETEHLSDHYSSSTESAQIYCSLRQYTKVKKCNLPNPVKYTSEQNISKTEKQSSHINMLSADGAKQSIKSAGIDGSVSNVDYDYFVAEALKNSACLQPRIFLTNIFENSEVVDNLDRIKNASFSYDALEKKYRFSAENSSQNENDSTAATVSCDTFIKRKRRVNSNKIGIISSEESFSDDTILQSPKSSKKKTNKKKRPEENKLEKSKIASFKIHNNSVAIRRKLNSDDDDSVISSVSKNKVQSELIVKKCKSTQVIPQPLSKNTSNMENFSFLKKSKTNSKDTKNYNDEKSSETKLLSFESVDPTCFNSLIKGKTQIDNIPSNKRNNLSLMDMLRRYTEKSNIEPDTSLLNTKNAIVEHEIDKSKQNVVNPKKPETGKLFSKKNRATLTSSRFSSPLLTQATEKDQPEKTLGGYSLCNKNVDINMSTEDIPSLCTSENTSLFDPFDTPEDCCKKPENSLTNLKSQTKTSKMPKSKNVSSNSVAFTRMQTRTRTNTLVPKNAKDLLNGNFSTKNLTEWSPKNHKKPKATQKKLSKVDKRKRLLNMDISTSENMDTENLVKAEKLLLAEDSSVMQSPSKKGERTLSSEHNISLQLNDKNSVTDIPSVEHCRNEKEDPSSASVNVDKNDGEHNGPGGLLNTEDLARNSNLSNSLSSTEFNGCQINMPRIFVNSANNSLIWPNPYVQLPSNSNQNFYSTVNLLAVQPQHPYVFQNFPLNSYLSLPCVTYPFFQTGPIMQQPNILNNNCNNNGLIGNGTVLANTVLNPISNLNLPGTFTGSRKVPIIIENTTSTIHTCTNTETIDTFPLKFKGSGFMLVKNIAEYARKLCVYEICDSALRYFTENESFSTITVKEFYMQSPLTAILEPRILESTVGYGDIAPKVEYIFEDSFHEEALRDVIKDYVAFHLDAVYKQPASKNYFVRKAFRYFPFRDGKYLCESFPTDSGEFNSKDIILFLSCSALLVILDECKRRNILS